MGPTADHRHVELSGVELGHTARKYRDRLEAHPLRGVLVVAVIVAVGHGVWIWANRRLGAFDPDEAGYIATSLRFHRVLSLRHPFEILWAVGGTANGPVVPLLSVPFQLVGPNDPRTVMLVQSLLLVVTAIAVAAIAQKISGSWAAIMSGITCLALPTCALATQSYWYGLGAAAAISCTVWAMLASERFTNRWTWVFGLGMATMVMTRTMTMAFVPGLAAGAFVLAWPDRRSLRRLTGAGALTVVIVGPWFAYNFRSIVDYLVSYGYGPRSELFGSGDFFERMRFRGGRMIEGAGLQSAVGLVLAVLLVLGVAPRIRSAASWRSWNWRLPMAIGTPIVSGFLALSSSSNNGVWFELPMIVLLVPLAVAVAAKAPLPARVVGIVSIITMLIGVTATTWWLIPPSGPVSFGIDGAQYEGGFRLYDARFSTDRRSEASEAAGEWAELSNRVADLCRAIDDRAGGVVFTMSGNTQLFNTNSFQLQAELAGWEALVEIPDTTVSNRQLLQDLNPTVDAGRRGRRERVLVVALHDQRLFTPDAEVDRFRRLAGKVGWVVAARVPMPNGGVVEVLRRGAS